MRKLVFDENGYLKPYQPIEIDIESFKYNFVDSFPNSISRELLYNNYLRFLYSFQDNIFTFFEQWIDGSFTTKRQNPNDIDVVTFLSFDVYEKRGDKVIDKYWKFSLEDQKIDSYIVKSYPEEHPNYSTYLSERSLWLDRYGTDRDNQAKGFVKIIFQKT